MNERIQLKLTQGTLLVFVISIVFNIILYFENKNINETTERYKVQLDSAKMVEQSYEINNALLNKRIEEYKECCKLK